MNKPLKAYVAHVHGSIIVFATSPAEAQERASWHDIETLSPGPDFPAGDNYSVVHSGLFAGRVQRYYGDLPKMPIYDTVEEAAAAWIKFQREVSHDQEGFPQWQTSPE